jgi:hypothetical protein
MRRLLWVLPWLALAAAVAAGMTGVAIGQVR